MTNVIHMHKSRIDTNLSTLLLFVPGIVFVFTLAAFLMYKDNRAVLGESSTEDTTVTEIETRLGK